MADCLATLDSLSSLRDGLANGDASARLQALELCRTMQAELENPEETLMKFVWAEVRCRIDRPRGWLMVCSANTLLCS